ncbi:MAG: hypothetical protein KC467_10775 [Marinomonas atlantica]|nr:hypothetical protein [Marinomonas atlantica]
MAHNKSLYQLPGFWLAIIIPLGLAAVAAGWIINHSSAQNWHNLLRSASGINEVLSMMKFPLGLAALVFPCVALVTANHRSVQTVAQHKATESKNSFENNIKHREVFRALLEKEEARWGIMFHDGDKLYEKIFSRNDYRRFEYYADDMKRDVFYKSCMDEFDKVAKNSCFIMPILDELTLYLQWFRKNRYHPHKTYKSLEVMFQELKEFGLLVGVKNSDLIPWESEDEENRSLKDCHPRMIHPYMNKMFEFLGNSFVEIIKFSYSSEFREDQQYLDQFLEFQHELSEAQEVLRGIVEQYQQE